MGRRTLEIAKVSTAFNSGYELCFVLYRFVAALSARHHRVDRCFSQKLKTCTVRTLPRATAPPHTRGIYSMIVRVPLSPAPHMPR